MRKQTPQAVAEVEYGDLDEAEQECDLFLCCTAGRRRGGSEAGDRQY
jgi:hypothetical protein